jgi:hypothetical protein
MTFRRKQEIREETMGFLSVLARGPGETVLACGAVSKRLLQCETVVCGLETRRIVAKRVGPYRYEVRTEAMACE